MAAIDNEGDDYKVKNRKCRIRDNIFKSLVKKHRSGKLSDLEYFNKVVAVNKDYDLPVSLQ